MKLAFVKSTWSREKLPIKEDYLCMKKEKLAFKSKMSYIKPYFNEVRLDIFCELNYSEGICISFSHLEYEGSLKVKGGL